MQNSATYERTATRVPIRIDQLPNGKVALYVTDFYGYIWRIETEHFDPELDTITVTEGG